MNNDLNKVRHSAYYTAPEASSDRWEELANVINRYITPKDVLEHTWMATVAAIFTNKSVEEIKAHARELQST